MNQFVLEKKAAEFRSINGFGSNDSIRLKSLLHKLDVLTVFRPLSADFSGMAIKTNDGEEKRFILINSGKTLGHQHFTICHELYHLYIQENFTSRTCMVGEFEKKEPEEYNADVFASYLLLPESGVKALIPDNELKKDKITLKTILKIEHFFSCSRAALLYRLKNLGIIGNYTIDKFKSNIKKGAVEYGYNISLYNTGNDNVVIGDYGTIARELFERERISESHYFSLLLDLGMNIDEIERIGNDEE